MGCFVHTFAEDKNNEILRYIFLLKEENTNLTAATRPISIISLASLLSLKKDILFSFLKNVSFIHECKDTREKYSNKIQDTG